jgi:hypothetical protein
MSGSDRSTVNDIPLNVLISRELRAAIETWIAAQPDPKPTHADAVRFILRHWMKDQGLLTRAADSSRAN